MRIGILSTCEGYEWAGSEENWRRFATAALKAGHQVMFGGDYRLTEGLKVQAMREMGLRVTSRHPRRPMRFYLAKEKVLPDMRAMLKFQPEALFLNAGSALDFCQLPYLQQFLKRFDVPKVLTLTFNSDLLPFTQREAIASFFSALAGVIFVSQQNRHLLERQIPGAVPQSIVIRNISGLLLEEPLPFPDGNTVNFGCVARFDTFWKGHDTLLGILGTPRWKERPWRLRLYGKGPDEDYVRRLTAFYGLEDRVEFCGWVDGVQAMWQDNHIMILPSRGEGLALSAVEAMMCGRPTILTPVGGTDEILLPGITGFLAESFQEHGIARAMEEAWSRRPEWKAMGMSAHSRARIMSQVDQGQENLNFFEEVVARHPRQNA